MKPCRPSEMLRTMNEEEEVPQHTQPLMYGHTDTQHLANTNLNLHKGPLMQPEVTNSTLQRDLHEYYTQNKPQSTLDPIAYTNAANYKYEMPDMSLDHVYGCSMLGGNNLIWDEERRRIIYTQDSIVIFESLNEDKSQRFVSEGHDPIHAIEMSLNGRLILAYTRESINDGSPMIYIWDADTLKKRAQISINQRLLKSASFSTHSNLLLVLSSDQDEEDDPCSIVAVWDFIDGDVETLCRSKLPFIIDEARWNLQLKNLEFITMSKTRYLFWRITEELLLQYQEGGTQLMEDPAKPDADQERAIRIGGDITITCISECFPKLSSALILVGLSNGYVWTVDTRTNSIMSQV